MRDPFDVPCPPWCRRPRNHQLALADRDTGGIARRVHLGAPDPHGRELEQFDTVGPDGTVTAGPVHVTSEHGRVPADGLAVLAAAVVVA